LGIIYGIPMMVIGFAITLFSAYGWVLEPSVAEEIDFAPSDNGGNTKEIAPLG
jgi:hypothetical protein